MWCLLKLLFKQTTQTKAKYSFQSSKPQDISKARVSKVPRSIMQFGRLLGVYHKFPVI